jgi:hypothetical protein
VARGLEAEEGAEKGGHVKSWITFATAALSIAVVFSGTPNAAPGAQEAGLSVPLRLSAFAVNMSTGGPRTTAVIDIRITRWATMKERENLLTIAVEKGPDDLLRALQKMPSHGRMNIPGWQGPDPHQARLGWELRYAMNMPGEDGGQRIVIATDRYIGMWEARDRPRTIDYPFTLIEMRLDKDGKGQGKMAVATKIEFDKKKNQMVLENYASEPVRLNEITIKR